MEGRRSIFSTKGDGEQIGYIEGAEAFNLSGQRRCRYDGQTGNLRDLGTGSIVGHVSLEGKFVGLSWRVDELFRQFDDDLDGAVRQEEASPNGVGEQLAQEPAPAEDEAPKSPDNHADPFGQMPRELVQNEASPNGVGEQLRQEPAPAEDEAPKSPDNHADPFGQMLRELVQNEASPNGVGEQLRQEPAPAEDEAPKSPDNHADPFGQMLRELVQNEASPNGVGEQLRQEPAPAEDEAPKGPHGNAMHPLRQVFAIANEVFGQRAIEDDQGFRNVGETPNPPSDGTEPPVRTNSAGERSGPFPEEAERIFEMLRNRIGLSAQVRDVDEMPIPTPEQTDAAVTTTIPARPSGPFSQEVERVFEMLRDKELD